MGKLLASLFRKLSGVVVLVGLLACFFTEGYANVTTDRFGRKKPPMHVQRLQYLLIFGLGVPGVAWGFARAIRGDQKTPWE